MKLNELLCDNLYCSFNEYSIPPVMEVLVFIQIVTLSIQVAVTTREVLFLRTPHTVVTLQILVTMTCSPAHSVLLLYPGKCFSTNKHDLGSRKKMSDGNG